MNHMLLILWSYDDVGRKYIQLQLIDSTVEITLLAVTGSMVLLCSRVTTVSGLGGSRIIQKYLAMEFSFDGRRVSGNFMCTEYHTIL